ncbi:hypothetical protein BJ508DRAFT_413237 [Ascobolus immersus RN42]|uniref:Uncharacterized protein n=1 Tax=Ascobolus immersus RN42 TaxID=1160509 RepID=A0A3N4IBT4_ASCIM|nr:hypothetical protein BJ508DRAFT_413237 [Ascobolus immersus RN42]
MDTVNPQKTIAFAERIAKAQKMLNNHMQVIVEAAAFDGKDRYVTAAETLQIDVHTEGMIKAAEDLLALSKELKEAWVLGQIGGNIDGVDQRVKLEEDAKVVGDAFKEWCTKEISQA